jgi:fluoride exporter
LPGRRAKREIAVIKIAILVFVGGALGAMLRELLMLMVPRGPRGLPLDILAANLVAALLLGLVAALHSRKVAPDGVYALIGTGITGGLSTFSSFVYGSVVLLEASTMSAVVALAYVVISLVLGYIAVIVGVKLGEKRPPIKDSKIA